MESKEQLEAPSPTYSTSISPSFLVRNLDEDPHTGLTPTSQSLGLKKPTKQLYLYPHNFRLLHRPLKLQSHDYPGGQKMI